jgi:DNA polymerase-3 subunit beta
MARDDAAVDTRKRATRIKAGTLRAALKDVDGVVQARNTIPMMAHVVIDARDGRLALTASDMDMWARRDLASDDRDGPASADWLASIRPFAICVPAKALGDVLAKIDGDAMVTLTAPEPGGDSRVSVKAGRARFQLICLPAADFPVPPPLEVETSFEMPCSALADAFAAVEHAISSEETRYYLNGVYVHTAQVKGEPQWLRLASTDGSRLARLSIEPPEGAACWPAAIVGRLTVSLLDKLLTVAAKSVGDGAEPAQVLIESCAAGRVRFAMPAADGGEIEVIAKTVDGTFPDYERVIPADPPLRAVIDRAAFMEAVGRVAVMATGKTRILSAEFGEDRVRLIGRSAELGDGEEEIDCAYEGDAMVIGFNSAFMLDALKAVASDHVSLRFSDGGGPIRIAGCLGPDLHFNETGALVQVVMPSRV